MNNNNNTSSYVLARLLRERLFLASLAGLIATSFYRHSFPAYHRKDMEILGLLLVLFCVINGLKRSGVFDKLAGSLEQSRFLPLKLVCLTAGLAVFVTNDVALLIMVPLTLTLPVSSRSNLIILEALAANAGSALTPFGNPQNLFIYWFYHVRFPDFILAVWPLTIGSMLVLAAVSLLIRPSSSGSLVKPTHDNIKRAIPHILSLLILILVVLRILPVVSSIIPLLYILLKDRRCLKIDYILLGTFFCFFGFSDNLIHIFNLTLSNTHHVFLFSSIASQFISNVPAALLFSDITRNWTALLWGVNVGGFGALTGSLANLIAYRIFCQNNPDTSRTRFLVKFHIISYTLFALGYLLHAFIGT